MRIRQLPVSFSGHRPNRSTADGPASTGVDGPTIGVLTVGIAVSALVLHRIWPLTLAEALYALLAIWAELVLVPPHFAGWPSQLFLIATLTVIGAGSLFFVVPTVVLALTVRLLHRKLLAPVDRQWPNPAFEVGAWLMASTVGMLTAQAVALELRRSPLGSLLFRPGRGEVGNLLVALSWALTVALLSVGTGMIRARLTGYAWPEVALAARARRILVRSVLISSVAYVLIAVCDATLGRFGPAILTGSIAIGLGWLSWRARQRRRQWAAFSRLAAIVEAKDSYTGDHLAAVAKRTSLVADRLALPGAVVDDYATGALLHDLGKLAVSCSALDKPGKLDPDELVEMRAHTTTGRVLLETFPGFGTAAAIAGHHHERWDGEGYPDRLAGTGIPLAARVVAVVDAFDAMTTDRPYHRAVSAEVALEELTRHKGSQFDPAVVAAFCQELGGRGRPPLWQFFAMTDE